MCRFDRSSVAFSYAWYSLLWSPTEYDARLHRLRVRLGAVARLESADEDIKHGYGTLVMRHNRLYVGFNRLYRRGKTKIQWPGTNNMRHGLIQWLKSNGLYEAVLAVTREA